MPEPTYRIAQRLHERRAAKGVKTYGRHLDADSQGCMLVHALEESADKTNYLIAEIQRRRRLMKWLRVISDEKGPWADWAWGWFVDFGGESALAQYDEILGTVANSATVAALPKDADAEAALATVWRKEAEAEICRMYGVDKRKIVAEAIADLSAEQAELREYRFSRYVNGKLKAEGAVVMATSDQHAAEKLTKLCCDHPAILIGGQMPPAPDPRDEALRVAAEALCDARDQIEALCSADDVPDSVHSALAAIRGAR